MIRILIILLTELCLPDLMIRIWNLILVLNLNFYFGLSVKLPNHGLTSNLPATSRSFCL